MSKKKTVSTETNIDINDLSKLVEETCLSCYGISAIASNKLLKDLKLKGKHEQGINFIINKKGISSDLYVISAQGVKMTEALRECQKNILYVVGKKYPLFRSVNITVVGVALR